MSLTPGTAFGPYSVLSQLGAGGMGEVYRARDTKLDRDVALKVLPESFALDGDRVARFTREAKTLAALNHPNIAAIYGVEGVLSTGSGHADSTRALVMELVEGDDLAQILTRGPLALDDALPIARQVADALEAAHEQGIIHRDLKPANIKIKPDGTVKVLDFGLAKAVNPAESNESAIANSPTLTARATQMGMILGTAAYMAPEQAKGRVVDKRADIWAFGAVLYEMLAGRRAFKGDDVTEVLASVIKDTPDFGAMPAGVPIRLKELLSRCLERDPRKRQRDMGDVQLELASIDQRRHDAVPQEPARQRRIVAMAGFAAAALVVGLAAGWWLHRVPTSDAAAGSVRLYVGPPVEGRRARWPQVSPDGRVVVFETAGRLYRRSLDGFDAMAIAGTDGATVPIMSPDGRAVAFFARGELKRVAIAGGDPITLTEANGDMPGGCWGPDDVILFARSWVSGLWAVPAGGGQARQVTEPDRSKGERGHWRPQFLPDGKHVLFSIMMAGTGVNDSRIALLDVASGKYQALFPGTDGVYLRSGHILYFHGGAWRVVPFDAAAARTTGEPTVVLTDALGVPPDGGSRGTVLSVSDTGVLAYLSGPTLQDRELVWINRSGAVEPLGLRVQPIAGASLSPDDRRVALFRTAEGKYEIAVADLARKTEDRLEVKGSNMSPLWDPRGEWLVFISERKGQYDTFIARPDGSGERALLTQDYDEQPEAWSRDGRRILVKQWRPDGDVLIVAVDAQTGGSPEVILAATTLANDVDLSRDDRWLLYASTRSNRSEIYVRSFTGDSATVRVSTEGGFNPLWSPSGGELFFRSGAKLMAVSVRGEGDRPEIGVPQPVIDLPTSASLFGVSSDGQRFLVGRLVGAEPAPGVRVVTNWFSEIGARAAK